jgi:hypothetical protein
VSAGGSKATAAAHTSGQVPQARTLRLLGASCLAVAVLLAAATAARSSSSSWRLGRTQE